MLGKKPMFEHNAKTRIFCGFTINKKLLVEVKLSESYNIELFDDQKSGEKLATIKNFIPDPAFKRRPITFLSLNGLDFFVLCTQYILLSFFINFALFCAHMV